MEKVILNFHIGRGGHFWNQGYLTFEGFGGRRADYTIEANFINPENLMKVSRRLAEQEDEEGNLLYEADTIMDDFYNLNREGFNERYNLSDGELGDDYLFDGSGNGIGGLPDEDGNYFFDIDGDYDTDYGKAITSFDELTEKERACLSVVELNDLITLGVSDVPTIDEEEENQND
jgi:hypothetical protein